MRPRIARLRTGRQTASPGSARGLGPGFRLALAAALVLAAALGLEVPCRAAGLVIEAPYVTAPVGSSGSFDLLLVNTNPAGGASYNVAADSFELSLSGPVAVTFTDVSINTIVAPYIYVSRGPLCQVVCRSRWTPSRTRSSRPPTPSLASWVSGR